MKLSYFFKTPVKQIIRLNDFLSEDSMLGEGMVLHFPAAAEAAIRQLVGPEPQTETQASASPQASLATRAGPQSSIDFLKDIETNLANLAQQNLKNKEVMADFNNKASNILTTFK